MSEKVSMDENPFIEAREKFPSAVAGLPEAYRNQNAAALLAVTEELGRSLRLELRLIQTVKNLDITNPIDVSRVYTQFHDYHESRAFDKERTRCHNIERIKNTSLLPLRAGSQADRDRVAGIEHLLNTLSNSDFEIIGDIEQVMDSALAAVAAINADVQAGQADSSRLDRARQKHNDFIKLYSLRFADLKATVTMLSDQANDLINRL